MSFFRGTALLVQLFWLLFVLPQFGILLEPLTVAVVGIGLNYGAYGAEVVRGAVLGVPRTQVEAAKALNLSPVRTFFRIILPQALPPIVPALGNYLITLFKETPLLCAVAVTEMLQTAKNIGSETFRYTEPVTIIGLIFLALSLVSATGIRWVERNLNRSWGIIRPR